MNRLSKITVVLGFISVVLDIIFNQAEIIQEIATFVGGLLNEAFMFLFQSVSIPLVVVLVFLFLFVYSVVKHFKGFSRVENTDIEEFPQKREYKNLLFIIDTTYSRGEQVLKIQDMICKICASNFFVQTASVDKKPYLVCENGHFVGGDLSPEIAKENCDYEFDISIFENIRPDNAHYLTQSLKSDLQQKFMREYDRQQKLELIQRLDESTG